MPPFAPFRHPPPLYLRENVFANALPPPKTHASGPSHCRGNLPSPVRRVKRQSADRPHQVPAQRPTPRCTDCNRPFSRSGQLLEHNRGHKHMRNSWRVKTILEADSFAKFQNFRARSITSRTSKANVTANLKVVAPTIATRYF